MAIKVRAICARQATPAVSCPPQLRGTGLRVAVPCSPTPAFLLTCTRGSAVPTDRQQQRFGRGRTSLALLMHADEAMYAAKQGKRRAPKA